MCKWKICPSQCSQPIGHNQNLGHEAILRKSQNNFMNLLITTSHYFNKYINTLRMGDANFRVYITTAQDG